ncbi:DUF2971 domain-containing protein [Flavobacterium sp. XGLA_31]|uniref:DUF2971 domain-containing protein n=1 Tax=Flavobacterium sp. XGLA_31 TaxID=3447666 RepID=UPI003F35576E
MIRWDTYHTETIKEKYVYRYLTIEKLIDFFRTNSIYLTRLDKFEDNLENISPYDINQLKYFSDVAKPKDANPDIPDSTWEEIFKKNTVKLRQIQSNLLAQQKERFVSCWILNDVESFAMWDIYGKSGFAIRFERQYFQNLIRDSRELQNEPTSKIDLLLAGKVEYQNFEEMLTKEKESTLKYSVFRKHLSFNHEAEYRIVGFLNNTDDETFLRFKLPDLETIHFEIIANPRLSSFQIETYNNIISNYTKVHVLRESDLKRWLEFRNINY